MTAASTRLVGAAAPSAAPALGRAAVAALHDELALDPKPGLVSPLDSGSHEDMTAAMFFRSLFALRRYFVDIAAAGARHAGFAELEALGIDAERRMLVATGGVNTHRGAVFSIGLLCAAAGAVDASNAGRTPEALRAALLGLWGDALQERVERPPTSRGARLAALHGLRSAGVEAAQGFPTLFDHAWPALLAARRAGLDDNRCRLQAFFVSMAVLDDTNLVHRGGLAGMAFARQSARQFLQAGGAYRDDAFVRAGQMRHAFVTRRLSPGGSADVLAAACWLARVAA